MGASSSSKGEVLQDAGRVVGHSVSSDHCFRGYRMSESPDVNRRRFFRAAAASVAAGPLGLLTFSKRLEAMTDTLTEVAQPTSQVTSDIRPFKVNVPESQLTDLRRRVKATKWPEKETVTDTSQGVQLA